MYDTQMIEEEWKEMLASVDILLLSIPLKCTKWLFWSLLSPMVGYSHKLKVCKVPWGIQVTNIWCSLLQTCDK